MSNKENDIISKKRQQQKEEQPNPADVLNQNLSIEDENSANPKSNVSRKRFTLDIRSDLHHKLKLQAIKQGKNMYELLEEALDKYL